MKQNQKMRKVLFTGENNCFLIVTDATEEQISDFCKMYRNCLNNYNKFEEDFLDSLKAVCTVRLLFDSENESDKNILESIGWDEQHNLWEYDIPEIERMITLSTGHIHKETASYIERQSESTLSDIVCFKKSCVNKEYGWFIYVPVDEIDEIVANKDIPNDLKKLMLYVADLNCCWLCLERDGVETNSLPKFTW